METNWIFKIKCFFQKVWLMFSLLLRNIDLLDCSCDVLLFVCRLLKIQVSFLREKDNLIVGYDINMSLSPPFYFLMFYEFWMF